MTKFSRALGIFGFLLFTTPALAADCWHKQGDPSEKLRGDPEAQLVWTHGKKKVTFEIRSNGEGTLAAHGDNDTHLSVERSDKGVILGDVLYEEGCK